MTERSEDNEDVPEDDVALDEIEAAYLRAMEATESMEAFLPPNPVEIDDVPDTALEPNVEDATSSPGRQPDELVTDSVAIEEIVSEGETEPVPSEQDQQVTSQQVIEALLFVGSIPLPGKKIVDILGGSTTHEQVDELIVELNELYRSQSRPYEIRLLEGGYQMALVSEFEPVRRRVYGQGPKDVKLNQESLEVLAFVAYQQPTSRARLEELDKKNVGGVLRQLLRRQLLLLERSEETGDENYRTTQRFLDLFGLASIDDLPQAMDFNFK